MRGACVYIVSNKTHRLYVGATMDIIDRVRQHKEKTYPNAFTARYCFDRLVTSNAAHPTKKQWLARHTSKDGRGSEKSRSSKSVILGGEI